MKKSVLIALFIFVSLVTKAQYIVINSRFKPLTFGEMVAPLIEASRAYERSNRTYEMPNRTYKKSISAYETAEQQFESYLKKENNELTKYQNKEQYSPFLGMYFINKCIEINNRFEEKIYDGGYLYYRKGIWHLLKDEEDEAKKTLLHAWQKYKYVPARDLYNHVVSK